ncbi:hypothetical protein G6F31_021388 [Rhizopus arrhizus]|nr:hypothetical protein G6F31_021388 [Rhizopus arrhizus]KAG1372288.1 hypothetical protein G6F59_018592 [Rhizopus arrhizus]
MTFDGDMIQNLPYVVSFELTYLPLVFAVLIALRPGRRPLRRGQRPLARAAGHPGLPGRHGLAAAARQHPARRARPGA